MAGLKNGPFLIIIRKLIHRHGSQVVRQESAKLLHAGSIPARASIIREDA